MPVNADYSLVRYEDGILYVELTPPTNIAGWSLRFNLQKRFGGTPFASRYAASGFNAVSGMSILDASIGAFSVDIYSTDLSGKDPINYAYTVDRTDSGQATRLLNGYLTLEL